MDEAALSELELQQELERFTTRFADRITQAAHTLGRSSHAEVRDEALRRNLLYVSSATEIATGAFPEVNLLDMIVFVRLCRSVVERHWIPELYGRAGGELAEVFARSEEELEPIAVRYLSHEQREALDDLAAAWLTENPDQFRVEGIRLADFSSVAGAAAAERSARATGLLRSVKSATRAANQALLLSERGLFLFHRLPFLWRLQAQLGVREIMSDAFVQLTEGPEAPLVRARQQARELGRGVVLSLGLIGAAGALAFFIGSALRRRR